MTIPRLGRQHRRVLIRIGRRSGDPDTAIRFLAVARLAAGRSTVAVSRELDIARSTVVKAAERFRDGGVMGLYDLRRHHGQAKTDDQFRRRVAQLMQRSPEHVGWQRPTWTRELLCRQMVAEGFARVAVCTMGRVLASIGARLKSPKPIVLCPWPRDAREKRLNEIRALEARASANEPVLYADEVDIPLNPQIGRDGMLRGQQRRVLTPGKNQKFYLAGALDVTSGVLHTTGASTENATLFCDLSRLVGAAYSKARGVHLIVDNDGIHKALVTRAALTELAGRVRLHFLPHYCADANRVERVWQDLHANVTRNHRCKTLRQLLGNCRRYLLNHRWRRVTGLDTALPRTA